MKNKKEKPLKCYYFSQRCHGIFTQEISVEASSEEEARQRVEGGHKSLSIENGEIDDITAVYDLELEDEEDL